MVNASQPDLPPEGFLMDSFTRSPSVWTVDVSRSVSKHEIQLHVEIGEAWPSVRTVLPWRPDVFDAEASRHYRAFRCLQRLVRMVAQESAVLTWKLYGIFIDIFLETCDHTHDMKWDTVLITWRLCIEPINLLKSNRYIKCFCQPKCCQYKKLTHTIFEKQLSRK
jgi:hypothetical protein